MTIPNYAAPSADDFIHVVDALRLDIEAMPEVNAETAPAIRDLLARTGEAAKKVESARKEAKEPHLEAGRQVDASFKPLLDTLAGLKDAINRPLAAFLKAEQDRQRAEAEAARKAAQEAAEFSRQFEDDPEIAARAKAFAEQKAKAADAMSSQADNAGRIGSATGTSRAAALRTYRRAEVEDAAKLVAHFASHPDVIDAALKAANAALRAAKGEDIQIPGVRVVEETKVA
jgi:hypothetical protein